MREEKPRCQRRTNLHGTYIAHTLFGRSCVSTWHCQDSLHFGILKLCFLFIKPRLISSFQPDSWSLEKKVFSSLVNYNDDDGSGDSDGGGNDVNTFLLFIQVILLTPSQCFWQFLKYAFTCGVKIFQLSLILGNVFCACVLLRKKISCRSFCGDVATHIPKLVIYQKSETRHSAVYRRRICFNICCMNLS